MFGKKNFEAIRKERNMIIFDMLEMRRQVPWETEFIIWH